jgi:hypothetical protein
MQVRWVYRIWDRVMKKWEQSGRSRNGGRRQRECVVVVERTGILLEILLRENAVREENGRVV